MAMQQCPNGHLYDDTKNNSCPYCGDTSGVNMTVPLSEPQMAAPQAMGNAFPQTMPIDNAGVPYATPHSNASSDNNITPTQPVEGIFGHTIDMSVNDKGIVEVRGWLVCIEGEKRGESYTLRGEKITIGRGATNDVKLDFDNAISKGVNMTISYDTKNNKFFVAPAEATKNNIYINDSLLMVPVELKDYDTIEIGVTKLIFRSLCNDQFKWENLGKAEAKAE